MSHDTPWARALPVPTEVKKSMQELCLHAVEPAGSQDLMPQPLRAGRPALVSGLFLSLTVLWSVLQGWTAQLEIWRQIAFYGLGPFAPVRVQDEAIYKRLDRQGPTLMRPLFERVSRLLGSWVTPWQQEGELAPFATEVYALDESTLDQVKRWLVGLRQKAIGDAALLGGRLCGLFDIRRQQWVHVDVLPDAPVDSRVNAPAMLCWLPPGALLLFDRGYEEFEWCDRLTQAKICWISRLRSSTSYRIRHILVQHDGYLEAIVTLGAFRSNRAAHPARLVRVCFRGKTCVFLSNVLDPHLLSGSQIAQLYARRWDIELGFRALKDHLQLTVLWGAKWNVVATQVYACLLLAQVFHAMQVRLAHELGVEIFDLSLDLLMRHVPRILERGEELVGLLAEHGRAMGIIRPSTRQRLHVLEVPVSDLVWPPPEWVFQPQTPRYPKKPSGKRSKGGKKRTVA